MTQKTTRRQPRRLRSRAHPRPLLGREPRRPHHRPVRRRRGSRIGIRALHQEPSSAEGARGRKRSGTGPRRARRPNGQRPASKARAGENPATAGRAQRHFVRRVAHDTSSLLCVCAMRDSVTRRANGRKRNYAGDQNHPKRQETTDRRIHRDEPAGPGSKNGIGSRTPPGIARSSWCPPPDSSSRSFRGNNQESCPGGVSPRRSFRGIFPLLHSSSGLGSCGPLARLLRRPEVGEAGHTVQTLREAVGGWGPPAGWQIRRPPLYS